MHTTIVIPTYNEARNIGELLSQIRKIAPGGGILVAGDNSPDDTGKIVKTIAASDSRVRLFARAGKEGLGAAYIASFKKILADGNTDVVVMMDADLSHDPKCLPAMLAHLEHGEVDVVVGSRYINGGSTEGWELWRRVLSRLGNYYCHYLTGLPSKDCTGGFNAMRTKFLRAVDFSRIDTVGYAFIMELKFALWQAGARFVEVPIVFKNRRFGKSKISGHIVGEGMWAPLKMCSQRLFTHFQKNNPEK